jgi:hypothetical protein
MPKMIKLNLETSLKNQASDWLKWLVAISGPKIIKQKLETNLKTQPSDWLKW